MFSQIKKIAFATVVAAVFAGFAADDAQANDHDKIYIQNDSSSTLWVAIRYQAPGQVGFVSQGYWKLVPGQRAYIADSNNQYIYFHAHNSNGYVWGGGKHFYVDGDLQDFLEVDTGSEYVEFTQRFTD